jgi:hypothetical protein
MGFGDKLKDLKQQAQEKVSENRERIQGAVDTVSVAANEKTHGKYANKILKVNEKAGSALNNLSGGAGAEGEAHAADQSEPSEPPVAGDAADGE